MELTQMLKMVRLTEDELIGGFITPKKGYYYIVLNQRIRTVSASLFGFQQGFLQLRKMKQKPKANAYQPESNIRLT